MSFYSSEATQQTSTSMFLCLFTLLPCCTQCLVPSVLWRCWLGGRKGIQPVKNWVVGCWLSVWSEVQTCIWPRWCHCHSLVMAHLGSPGQRTVTRVCVHACACVCACACACVCVTCWTLVDSQHCLTGFLLLNTCSGPSENAVRCNTCDSEEGIWRSIH